MGWWSEVVTLAADVVTSAAVFMGAAVLPRTRLLSAALSVVLDLLLAAGLLRLSGQQSWASLGSAAAVIVVRQVAMAGIRVNRPDGATPGGPLSRPATHPLAPLSRAGPRPRSDRWASHPKQF